LCQIRDCEWCHPGNKRLKFNVIVTTYEIVLKDKVTADSVLMLIYTYHYLEVVELSVFSSYYEVGGITQWLERWSMTGELSLV